MTAVSTVVDLYLDLNILLLAAVLPWLALAVGLRLAGLGDAVSLRLAVLRYGFLCVLAAPVIGLLFAGPPEPSGRAAGISVTDFVLAQYLQGRFTMDPFVMEGVLSFRGAAVAEVTAPQSWAGPAVVGVFLGGVAFFVLRLALAARKLRRVMQGSYPWRRFGRVDLHLSDTLTVPFSTRGLLRRHVVLPSVLLEREGDLRIAVAHEFQHLRQGDVEWEIVVQLLRPFLFWNPAFLMWKREVEELRELACDRRLVARRRLDVAGYCRCLLRVCHDSLAPRRLFAVRMPVVGLIPGEGHVRPHRAAGQLRRRMEALVEGRTDAQRPRLALALMLPVAGLVLLAAMAMQGSGDWSQDRLMLSTILNLERLEAMNATIPSLAVPGW